MECCMIFAMAANAVFLGSVIMLILGGVLNIFGLLIAGANITILSGILYYLCVCSSDIAQYVKNPIPASEIYKHIEELFKKGPILLMKMECYHTYRFKNKTRRRVTHRAEAQIPYLTWKDISGEFSIDKTPATAVMLDLEVDVNYFEDGTQEEIEQTVSRFKIANTKDIYQNYQEITTVENFQPKVLVMMSETCNCFLNRTTFWILSILPFFFLYYFLFYCLCTSQKFKVCKLVSTKTDLLQINDLPAFKNPCITRMGESISFAQGGSCPPPLPIPQEETLIPVPQEDTSTIQNVQVETHGESFAK